LSTFSTQFGRQYGLVRQNALEDLNILIIGSNEILPYLLLNLAFLGVGTIQGGVYLKVENDLIDENIANFRFLLSKEDIGTPLQETLRKKLKKYVSHFDLQIWPVGAERRLLPDLVILLPAAGTIVDTTDVPCAVKIFGQLAPAGVYVGHRQAQLKPFPQNVLTGALASLGGAILAQEVLRLTNLVRANYIVDHKLQVQLRVRSRKLNTWLEGKERGEPPVQARLRLGGEPLEVEFMGRAAGTADALFQISFPRETHLSRLIFDSVELIEEPLEKSGGLRDPLLISPFGNEILKEGQIIAKNSIFPDKLHNISVAIFGIGGIGAWLSAVLASVPCDRIKMVLIDHDRKVEEHNLNRQVLYKKEDIGGVKVRMAAKALKRIRDDIILHYYPFKMDEEIARMITEENPRAYDEAYVEEWVRNLQGIEPGRGRVLDPDIWKSMLASDIRESDVLFSCFDNMRSRWILDCTAFLARKVFINGGIEDGLVAMADYINMPGGDACLVARKGRDIIEGVEHESCSGPQPTLAIVTSNSIAASLQAILFIGTKLDLVPEYNYFSYNGETGFFGFSNWKDYTEHKSALCLDKL
jgi:molybdopterin/thiamine biosynthesis adenylyltransferase